MKVRLSHREMLSQAFYPNIGSPGKDAISLVFFIVFLNKALCELKNRLPMERPKADIGITEDAEYADDTHFFSTDEGYLE